MTGLTDLDLGIEALRTAYQTGKLTCSDMIAEVLRRLEAAGDDRVWISRCADPALRATAATLDKARAADPSTLDRLPLFGVPFAIKDNIDLEGVDTTAACPGFAYRPGQSAQVVAALVAAGAIPIGKTNLDQFATGLVGVRSPYGVPRNPFDAAYVPGGSSSGSAVAVAAGLVSFALGTDTAGSGRVPAGFNNIVGLKPTPGRVPTAGVVPACRSLDCVSVFALSCADAASVFQVLAPAVPGPALGATFRFGVLRAEDRAFFGDAASEAIYDRSIQRMIELGGTPHPFDYAPFRDAAQLLYSGPWVAERTAAVGRFIESADASAGVWPTTRDIVMGGKRFSAVDAFEGQYRLAELAPRATRERAGLDFLLLPTSGTIYRVADLEREPVLFNSNLGHYTNFVNFFGLAALALPAGFRPDGLPVGVTLVGEADSEAALLALGDRWQRATALPLGRTSSRLPTAPLPPPAEDRVEIVVVGAHMSGLPLNGQLVDLGGRLERAGHTAPEYRFFVLPGGPPQRPGLVRVAEGGARIAHEVWSLPAEQVGALLRKIPAPLGLGQVRLDDGTSVSGFLCEAIATQDARDITALGGWRAFLATG